MKDFVENLEDAAEAEFDSRIKNGLFQCYCGVLFDPFKNGYNISSNPYAMPVCGECFDKWFHEQILFRKF